jgi:hypothetical protein
MSSRPNEQSLIPHLAVLERGEGLKQQTDEQQKGKTAVDGSLLKVECGTIHGVGSFRGLGTGIVPDSHKGAELYFVTQRRKDVFPSATVSTDTSLINRGWSRLALDHYIYGGSVANYYMQG